MTTRSLNPTANGGATLGLTASDLEKAGFRPSEAVSVTVENGDQGPHLVVAASQTLRAAVLADAEAFVDRHEDVFAALRDS
jgi:hypothetical protein